MFAAQLFQVCCVSDMFHSRRGEVTANREHEEKKRWQGEEEGLLQPTEWPLQGRSAWGLAGLGAGDLSQDGQCGEAGAQTFVVAVLVPMRPAPSLSYPESRTSLCPSRALIPSPGLKGPV